MRITSFKLLLILLCLPKLVLADELKVAVASNFVSTMRVIANEFESQTGHRLLLSSGSSGKHFAQIKHGAPFDVFFSADSLRIERLEQEGYGVDDTRFTYAYGRLVLWGNKFQKRDGVKDKLLFDYAKRIAVANPRLAPYGLAAQQVLQSLGAYEKNKSKLVLGENINQAYLFVRSGNVELGLLSYAQVVGSQESYYWLIPNQMHEPIEQQAIILKDSSAARALFKFMQSKQALQMISEQGYDTFYVN